MLFDGLLFKHVFLAVTMNIRTLRITVISLKWLKILALYNEKIVDVVLDQAPLNATYTSPKIQKKILHIFSEKIWNDIR